MARCRQLEFLLSKWVLAFLIFVGFIPVAGTVLFYCSWIRWVWQ